VRGLLAPWADPGLTSSSRLRMHGVPHADRLSLDGRWRFQLLPRPDAAPTSEWSEIDVPGCWTMQGFADRPHYTNVVMPFAECPPTPPAANPTGHYARFFEVPAAWEGRRVVLHVGAAESVLLVRLNDRDVGISKDSHLAAEFDITSHVVPGRNELVLDVVKWSDASFIEDQDQWWHGGITRPVYLYATSPTYLADIRVDAGLADDLIDGTLDVVVEVGFPGGTPLPGWQVEAELDTGQGRLAMHDDVPARERTVHTSRGESVHRRDGDRATAVAAGMAVDLTGQAGRGALSGRALPPQDGRVAWSIEVPGVTPWSAEIPTLYSLTISLRAPSGEVVEQVTHNIGFRRVEIAGLELLVNGRPVLIHGVNRHDFDPRTGRVVSVEAMRADVVLMKRFGFNAVRTSHYPNDPAFLDLCDELGMYVIDEADIECHAFYSSLAWDQRYLGAWVDRVSRMALRDRNHPCVIAWSLGNESGYGPNHDAAAAWLRRLDPTRPLHYEGAIRSDWAGPQGASDILAPMYPSIAAIVSHATSGRMRHPLIMCEYSHSMGNSNGTLAEYWDAIEATPGLQGGFIWEWRDHGLEQTLPDGRTRWAYGGDFGDVPHDGAFCLDGIVFPDRSPKPAAWEHRALAAPVRVAAAAAQLARGEVEIENRLDFRDLSWLECRWTLATDGEEIGSGDVALPHVAPGGHATIAIAKLGELAAAGRAHRPASGGNEHESWLTLRFTARADEPWAPAGFEVACGQIRLDGSATPEPRRGGLRTSGPSMAPPSVDESGLLVHPLLAEPPVLSLWRAPTDNDLIAGLARKWAEWGIDRLERLVEAIERTDDAVVVHCTYRTAAGIDIPHRQALRSLEGGGILLEEEVEIPGILDDLPRVGTVFETVGGLEALEWFGSGPHESYPDRRRGGLVGRWLSTVGAQYVPYVRPQENGGHADVRWFGLRDPAGTGLRVVLDRPRQVSVTHLRAADLAAATHDVDLAPRAEAVVHVDAFHRGLGTASCGPDTLPAYLLQPGRHGWSWQWVPLGEGQARPGQ
jgi:beta-galactosidase